MVNLDDSYNKVKIGESIRSFRREKGFSQKELAQNIGKESATYIATIEKGKRNILITDCIKIAEELGVTVSVLLGEGQKEWVFFEEALKMSDDLTEEDKRELKEYYKFIKIKKSL